MTAARQRERESRVPFFRSIQAKYALTYLLVVAAILIVMNTYPILMAENMVFTSKESNLKRQALVIGSTLAVSETLTREGVEQTIHLRWSAFRAFLETCRQPDGPKDFKALSLDVSKRRPRLVFDGNKANLHAAVSNSQIRRKLGKALMTNFCWPDADEVHLTNDFVPYSFFFREYQNDRPCLCGGLILHGQEDMSKAYYGIHT